MIVKKLHPIRMAVLSDGDFVNLKIGALGVTGHARGKFEKLRALNKSLDFLRFGSVEQVRIDIGHPLDEACKTAGLSY